MENKIKSFKVLTERALVNNLLEFEIEVQLNLAELNVYKKDEVDITIKIVSVSGKIITADAFYYEEYSFAEDGKIETRTDKKPCFRIRVMPSEEGEWNYEVSLNIKNKNEDTINGCINIYKSEKESRLLSVEPNRKQVFATPLGEPVIMIGENLNYNVPISDKESFAKYITENMKILAHNGANHVRIFDKIECGSQIREGVYNMSQKASAMWDKIIKTADDLGMYVTFVLMDFCELANPQFAKSCWHEDNGGYLTNSIDFFSDEKSKAAYKEYLRYIVSRFGYSESILTWEFFNELDRTDAIFNNKHEAAKEWLAEMTGAMRSLDQARHMLSNSIFFINLVAAYYKPFDFIYYHQCNHATVSYLSEIQKNSWRAYRRPSLNGDGGVVGATKALCGDSISPELTVVHQGNWAGVMGGGAGTVMNNDWQRLSEHQGEWCYKAIFNMAKKIPWCNKEMKMVTAETVKVSNRQISLLGYMDSNFAYLWFYNNHLLPIRKDETVFEAETVSLSVENGLYSIIWIDTLTGEYISKETISVNDIIDIKMPVWTRDIALIVEAEN